MFSLDNLPGFPLSLFFSLSHPEILPTTPCTYFSQYIWAALVVFATNAFDHLRCKVRMRYSSEAATTSALSFLEECAMTAAIGGTKAYRGTFAGCADFVGFPFYHVTLTPPSFTSSMTTGRSIHVLLLVFFRMVKGMFKAWCVPSFPNLSYPKEFS